MLHKGFPIKTVLHKVSASNVACTLCGRYEIVEYVFLRCPSMKRFWALFKFKFNIFYSLAFSKMSSPWGYLDDYGRCKSLWT